MEEHRKNIDHHIRHCGETLLRIPGLPSKLKRDLRDLLNFSKTNQADQANKAVRLLDIYTRAVKIIATNPELTHQDDTQNAIEKELFLKLSDELQILITELDFEGDSGDHLNDIRARLLIGVTPNTLLEVTLDVLRLVVQATGNERKQSKQFFDQINASLEKSLDQCNQNIQKNHTCLAHRQEMTQELNQLATKYQITLRQSRDLQTLKAEISPLLEQLSSLSERLNQIEQREHTLLEQMKYTQHHLETLYQSTYDYQRCLEEQAEKMLKDPLTKVFNRTAFTDRLKLEYHRWIRSQHSLRIALFDIDNFKFINKNFGYSAGDKALRVIARTILREVSKTDTVARYAGEEFILMMPERNDQESYSLIQRIQQYVQKLPFKFKDKNLTITISVASIAFKQNDTPEDILEQLRQVLRQQQNAGPNQIVWK
jgi:diguanylate cyclase (GGDEF)-like protein